MFPLPPNHRPDRCLGRVCSCPEGEALEDPAPKPLGVLTGRLRLSVCPALKWASRPSNPGGLDKKAGETRSWVGAGVVVKSGSRLVSRGRGRVET